MNERINESYDYMGFSGHSNSEDSKCNNGRLMTFIVMRHIKVTYTVSETEKDKFAAVRKLSEPTFFPFTNFKQANVRLQRNDFLFQVYSMWIIIKIICSNAASLKTLSYIGW